jgi:N-acetyl-D-muramate 6-phosphate phosphatase
MPLEAVFFDLDGTLLDTSGDLGNALNKTLHHYNRTPLPLSAIREHVSNGATALVKLGFGHHLEHDEMVRIRTELLNFYIDDIASHTVIFNGIGDLIQQLTDHQILWGIVTNKPLAYTEALMQHFHFASPPSATVCPEHKGMGKPDPTPLLHACELVRVSPANCVYVGDHERDIECGRNAGMPTLAVGYGFTADADEYLSWNADHNAELPEDIWPILQKHFL